MDSPSQIHTPAPSAANGAPKSQRDGSSISGSEHPQPSDKTTPPVHQSSPNTQNSHKRKRLKIAVACNGCRDKKLKCDGKRPACSTCQRKGITAHCAYDEGRSRNQFSQEYVASLNKRIEDLEALLRSQSAPREMEARPEQTIIEPSSISMQPQSETVRATAPSRNSNELQSPDVGYTLAVPNANSGYPLSFVRNEPAISSPPLPLGVSTPLPSQSNISPDRTPPNISHGPGSPPTEEIDAMGAIIHETDDTCQSSSSTTARDLAEKDGFYGGSSVASFMKEIRSSSSGRLPTMRKPRSSTISSATQKSPTVSRVGISGAQDIAGLRRGLTFVEMYVLPPRAIADHLMDCYWDNVHSMYPFLHRPTFMKKYNELWTNGNQGPLQMELDPQQGIFYGSVNVVFALGCKFSPSMTLQEREANAEVFIDRSKPLIQIEIIDMGSLELVQMMLLMGLLMQSTTAANRCWNAFGMAIRISQGLGMHLEGNIAKDPDPLRREIKRRTWHTCVIFDRVLAMTLGRPCVIRKNHVLLPQISGISSSSSSIVDRPPEYMYHVLFIKLCSILGDILFKVYEPLTDDAGLIAIGPNIAKILKDTQCTNSIVELDAALQDFWENVPKEFLPETNYPCPIIKRHAVILRANYLHFRIFLFRPLLSILTTKPAVVKEANMMHSYMFVRGSIYCLHAALELIELIYANYASGNVPPWWYNVLYIYTAAAVLIAANHRFQHFKTETTSEQICASVGKAKEILQNLQSVSRAAQACLSILEGFDQNQCGNPQGGTAATADNIDARDQNEQHVHQQQNHYTGNAVGETLSKDAAEMRGEEARVEDAPINGGGFGGGGGPVPMGIQMERFEHVQEGMGIYTWPLDAGAGSQEFLLPSFEWLMASGDLDADAGVGIW